MKLLKKQFKQLVKQPLKPLIKLYQNLFIRDKMLETIKQPNLVLTEHIVLVEDETKKPYFIISPNGNHSVSKLYITEFITNKNKYKNLFSVDDYGHMMFCSGGLHSMELNNVFQITTFDLGSETIEVRHKSTCINEFWNISNVIATQKYLLLDKSSILKLGMLFQQNNIPTDFSTLSSALGEKHSNLKLIK